MTETAFEHEPVLRLAAFLGVFALAALWEACVPRRALRHTRRQRWPHNLALLALDAVTVRLLAPGATIALAWAAAQHGWGLLNAVAMPGWLSVLVAIVALDLAIYVQHRLFHAVPLLWRLHRVHHADPDFDLTTAARFHPLEILLSLAFKALVIVALGAPALAVFAFEVVLNAAAMFNHANGRVPPALDRWLRWVVVTPDMHRVHHSASVREMNSNFGFNLPWWDRLFRTYRARPAGGHRAMAIGVAGLHSADELALSRLLTQPFRIPVRDRNHARATTDAAATSPFMDIEES